MKPPRRVLTVCHDAGGARAVMPVARELERRGASVFALVAGPAAKIWPAECPEVERKVVADALAPAEAGGIFEVWRIEALLTACGLYNCVEHTLRVAARERGLWSVAVLDSWLNYAERFQRTSNGVPEECQPDRICVLDELSYRGMVEAGFKPEQVVITGPPNLESTVEACRSISPEETARRRGELGVRSGDVLITFFSDPFYIGPRGETIQGPGALMGPDGRSLFGYTSVGILGAVLEELGAMCQAAQRAATVVVKPHPMEYAEDLRPLAKRGRRPPWLEVVIQDQGAAAEWIALSDALIGMMSIALLEGALVGKPALSVQIGLRECAAEDPCIANLLGYTIPIHTRQTLRDILLDVCRGELAGLVSRPTSELKVQGAAARVATVVLEAPKVRRGGGCA